jgi:hypothetical protein
MNILLQQPIKYIEWIIITTTIIDVTVKHINKPDLHRLLIWMFLLNRKYKNIIDQLLNISLCIIYLFHNFSPIDWLAAPMNILNYLKNISSGESDSNGIRSSTSVDSSSAANGASFSSKSVSTSANSAATVVNSGDKNVYVKDVQSSAASTPN